MNVTNKVYITNKERVITVPQMKGPSRDSQGRYNLYQICRLKIGLERG